MKLLLTKNYVAYSTKVSLLICLLLVERATYVIDSRSTASLLSQHFHVSVILVNVPFHMTNYLCLTHTMAYRAGVLANHSQCAVKISSLLAQIGRHLPNTTKKLLSKARQHQPM